MAKFAYAVLHDGKGRFLLGTKNETGFFFSGGGGEVYKGGIDLKEKKCGGKRALPGGAINAGEATKVAAMREFTEETGISLAGCTAQEKEWAGQAYGAGYFGTAPANFDKLLKEVKESLGRGRQAAKEIADGKIKTYADLRKKYPSIAKDDEIMVVEPWDVRKQWITIKSWEKTDPNCLGWFVPILEHLKDNLSGS
ncbi:NUDIX hydrolase [Streptomyces sp. NPDC052095]|uniref:NUDIX hydrolase n=1 Tax=unclassified Streptomyces TaxID=2593676 RepID=UPI00344E4AB7